MKQMNPPKKPRSNADITRRRIARSAVKLFVKNGFAATSISQIAKGARINQSLIYHHFGSKQNLWKFAKESLAKKQAHFTKTLDDVRSATLSIEDFIYRIITLRFECYDKNPDLVRMISWQLLEPEGNTLLGTQGYNRSQFLDTIQEMQAKNLITHRYPAKVILTYLIQQINPSLFTYADLSAQDRQDYLNMVTKMALEKLTPHDESF